MSSEADFDPTQNSMSQNFTILGSHVLQKGFQAGSLLGVAIVAPIMCIRKKSFDFATVSKAVTYSAVTATALTGVMLGAKASTMDKEGLEDRVYRLHYNQGQNRTDLFSQVGGVLGGAAAFALGPMTPIGILGGAGVGTAFGIAAHIVSKEKDEKSENSMVQDIKS